MPSPSLVANPRWPLSRRTAVWLALPVLAAHAGLLWTAAPTPSLAPGPAHPVWRVSLPAAAVAPAPEGAAQATPPGVPAAVLAPPQVVFKKNTLPAPVKSGDSATHSGAKSDLDMPPDTAPAPLLLAAVSAAAPPAHPPATVALLDTAPAQASASEASDASPQANAVDPALVAQVSALANAKVKVPAAVRLNYRIEGKAKGFGFSGKGHLLWQPGAGVDPAAYEAQLVVGHPLLGSRSQVSSGRLTAHGLAPTRFADKARSEQAAHFVRDKGQIVFSANAPQAALMPGAQDRLSVVLQLSSLLAGNPGRFSAAGRTLPIQTAGAKDAEVWQFVVQGEETLDLPGGELRTLKLVRKPRHAYDQQIELWFAEKLGFLPVRIKLSQVGGNVVDQTWESSETP